MRPRNRREDARIITEEMNNYLGRDGLVHSKSGVASADDAIVDYNKTLGMEIENLKAEGRADEAQELRGYFV